MSHHKLVPFSRTVEFEVTLPVVINIPTVPAMTLKVNQASMISLPHYRAIVDAFHFWKKAILTDPAFYQYFRVYRAFTVMDINLHVDFDRILQSEQPPFLFAVEHMGPKFLYNLPYNMSNDQRRRVGYMMHKIDPSKYGRTRTKVGAGWSFKKTFKRMPNDDDVILFLHPDDVRTTTAAMSGDDDSETDPRDRLFEAKVGHLKHPDSINRAGLTSNFHIPHHYFDPTGRPTSIHYVSRHDQINLLINSLSTGAGTALEGSVADVRSDKNSILKEPEPYPDDAKDYLINGMEPLGTFCIYAQSFPGFEDKTPNIPAEVRIKYRIKYSHPWDYFYYIPDIPQPVVIPLGAPYRPVFLNIGTTELPSRRRDLLVEGDNYDPAYNKGALLAVQSKGDNARVPLSEVISKPISEIDAQENLDLIYEVAIEIADAAARYNANHEDPEDEELSEEDQSWFASLSGKLTSMVDGINSLNEFLNDVLNQAVRATTAVTLSFQLLYESLTYTGPAMLRVANYLQLRLQALGLWLAWNGQTAVPRDAIEALADHGGVDAYDSTQRRRDASSTAVVVYGDVPFMYRLSEMFSQLKSVYNLTQNIHRLHTQTIGEFAYRMTDEELEAAQEKMQPFIDERDALMVDLKDTSTNFLQYTSGLHDYVQQIYDDLRRTADSSRNAEILQTVQLHTTTDQVDAPVIVDDSSVLDDAVDQHGNVVRSAAATPEPEYAFSTTFSGTPEDFQFFRNVVEFLHADVSHDQGDRSMTLTFSNEYHSHPNIWHQWASYVPSSILSADGEPPNASVIRGMRDWPNQVQPGNNAYSVSTLPRPRMSSVAFEKVSSWTIRIPRSADDDTVLFRAPDVSWLIGPILPVSRYSTIGVQFGDGFNGSAIIAFNSQSQDFAQSIVSSINDANRRIEMAMRATGCTETQYLARYQAGPFMEGNGAEYVTNISPVTGERWDHSRVVTHPLISQSVAVKTDPDRFEIYDSHSWHSNIHFPVDRAAYNPRKPVQPFHTKLQDYIDTHGAPPDQWTIVCCWFRALYFAEPIDFTLSIQAIRSFFNQAHDGSDDPSNWRMGEHFNALLTDEQVGVPVT